MEAAISSAMAHPNIVQVRTRGRAAPACERTECRCIARPHSQPVCMPWRTAGCAQQLCIHTTVLRLPPVHLQTYTYIVENPTMKRTASQHSGALP